MISTSGRVLEGGTGELATKTRKQIPHGKAVRNDKDFGLGRSDARNSKAFRSGINAIVRRAF